MSEISVERLEQLIQTRTPFVDVRAPVEFNLGTLPGAINLPIMNDVERAAVGTAYKQSGHEAAMRLGHELVSGQVKETRLRAWADYKRLNPNAVLFCFRGGSRSQIAKAWLSEMGIDQPILEGGYKAGRRALTRTIERYSKKPFLILSGPTGSGKTRILNQASQFYPTLDLEGVACHRGSAFGAMLSPQPTQINFEHGIAASLLQLRVEDQERKILIEDESRLIGSCAVPATMFQQMRASDLIFVEESLEQRVENIFQDYVVKTGIGSLDIAKATAQFEKFKQAVRMISRKLGGARAQELLGLIDACESAYLKSPEDIEGNRAWISKLLIYYYDPAYSQGLKKRNFKVSLRGSSNLVLDHLKP